VPVSWLFCNRSHVNFANRPNSAGMEPGEYKTQSKHTKTKSSCPTGTIGLAQGKSPSSYTTQVKGRGMEYRQVGYVATASHPISPIGPMQPGWDLGTQNSVKTYENQVTLSDCYDRACAGQGNKRGESAGKLVLL
jgi:hypothetical protein